MGSAAEPSRGLWTHVKLDAEHEGFAVVLVRSAPAVVVPGRQRQVRILQFQLRES